MVGCLSVSVSAKGDITVKGMMRSKKRHAASVTNHKETAEKALSKYVDLEEFESVVMSGISDCKSEIDISKYKIPTFAFDIVTDYFFYSVPEAFNLDKMSCTYYTYDNIMVDLTPTYSAFADTANEYDACYSKMVYGAESILKGVKGNTKLNDEQKLLILHDRLAIWNMYDYDRLEDDNPIIYTAYGALGEGSSVCQGYAMAYMYLLDQVGIDSYYCSSEKLCHGWNIVYLNGKKYHVDVTWDDTDFRGEVGHDNFLRSSDGIYAAGHNAIDYDTTPIDTKYDNYFWQDYDAEFQLVNNEIYYIDYASEEIKRYSDKKAVCSVAAIWTAGTNSYWKGNFSYLASDGKSLFYSQPDAIYRLDLTTNKSQKIYTPKLAANESIYSVGYRDATILCYVGFAPYNSDLRLITHPYEYDYGNDNDEKHCAGDSNNDGKIDNKDYAILMQYLNGWNVSVVKDSSDVNADGSIDNKDYALLMQYLNGWDVILK